MIGQKVEGLMFTGAFLFVTFVILSAVVATLLGCTWNSDNPIEDFLFGWIKPGIKVIGQPSL